MNKIEKKCTNKLDKYITNTYSEEEIDNFSWGVDTQDDRVYRYNFTDDKGIERKVVCNKVTFEVNEYIK